MKQLRRQRPETYRMIAVQDCFDIKVCSFRANDSAGHRGAICAVLQFFESLRLMSANKEEDLLAISPYPVREFKHLEIDRIAHQATVDDTQRVACCEQVHQPGCQRGHMRSGLHELTLMVRADHRQDVEPFFGQCARLIETVNVQSPADVDSKCAIRLASR